MVSEQFFSTSADGTKVPYFVVRSKSTKMDGTNPTLLYGYGGFEISLNPSYSATRGKLWLENGGVYVLANIRGGGEYGPCLLYTSPSPRDLSTSRMPSSA